MATASPRPTLLIGYGRFGLDLLQNFLFSAATRGVLAFEEQGGIEGGRRLRDLALLWVSDPLAPEPLPVGADSVPRGSETELMRDLNEQIQRIEETDAEAPLREAMKENAESLLDAARRAPARDPLPLGLDVIVAAHPASLEDFGRLGRLLAAGADEIKRYATQLESAVATAGALHFIQVLDFENYRQDSEPGRALREALRQSVDHWRKREAEGRASFGRIYLVDGFTAQGTRGERTRIDEITLFLEFLLFEGRRGGDLQGLYQPRTPGESPLATFGIRLHERSAGLLGRLAAAWFGMAWLNYLAGDNPPQDADIPEFRRRLAPFRAEALAQAARSGPGEAEPAWGPGLAGEMERLDVADPDWPGKVRATWERAAGTLAREAGLWVRERLQALSRQAPWSDLPGQLREAVAAALHHDRRPLPLGVVIRELEAVYEELRRAPMADTRAAPAGGPWTALAALHGDYRRFRREQLDTGGFRRFLPWFAGLLGLAVTPVLAAVLDEIPRPDPAASHFLLQQAYRFGQWLAARPWLLALGLWALFWGGAAATLVRGMDRRSLEAGRFWNEPERGRLVDRLRRMLSPGGALGAPFHAAAEERSRRLAASLRGEVGRELGRMLVLLRKRRREMQWLRGQLHEFLKHYGLDPMVPRDDWSRMSQETTGIRHALEQYRDFERILESNPPSPDRFPSVQAGRKPFRDWDQPYSDAFLYPLRFIDELSRLYRDPYELPPDQSGGGAEQAVRTRELLGFFRDLGRIAPAFDWPGREGVPLARAYCLLAPAFASMEAIRRELRDLGIAEGDILAGDDTARSYLLTVQIGVAPECLSN